MEEQGEYEKIVHLREVRAKAATKRNTGRTQAIETKQKIAVSCTGVTNVLKGKTFEAFYGSMRAKELGDEHSRKLKEGYATGRLKPTARSCSAPVLRGVRLRSQLEQSAIEFLEKRDGLVFEQTLLYEDPAVFVQWFDAEGRSHTYVPDLHDIIRNVVYEVKPAWRVNAPTDEMQRKKQAMLNAGHKYQYLTDLDLRNQSHENIT